jgi:diguanylate cyclase (GGDEF)-like protein/PAS domain S-box-containing protein
MTAPIVLVVEDNTITREAMRRCLEAAHLCVVEAPDGTTALAQAEAVQPALIMQDMHLPDMDGFELLERLRKLPGIARIPIVAITGDLPERGSSTAQFTDVLLKPIETARLLRVIKVLLLGEPAETGPTGVHRRALLAEDDPVQRKVLRLYLRQWGFEVTEAANGAEALRLAVASPPDVVVSDLLMPELDGLSLCLALRREAALATVPIILVSSHHIDEVDHSIAAHSGASAVVSRSHDMAELHEALNTTVRITASGSTPPPLRHRSTRENVSHLVAQLKREADVREQLVDSRAAVSALLPFFESFADLRTHRDGARADVDRTIDELLAGYLDASGAALGCAFLDTPPAGLILRSYLGYREPIAADLPSFFGRLDLLERALDRGTALEVPSPELGGDDIDRFLRRADVASMILVPLALRGERLGVLALGSQRASRPAERLRVAEAARGPIAQALALARNVAELVRSRQAFRGIVDSTSDGIVVTDDAGKITYANPAALTSFGYSADALVGRAIAEILPFLGSTTETRTGAGLRSDGVEFPTAITVTAFEDAPGHFLRAHMVRDLSLRETLDQLAVLANRDGLTGLFNRRRFDEHVSARVDEAIRYNFSGALVMLDLDGFKAINDAHGHQAGDAILKTVAEALRSGTRASDFVARLGGDEFALELPHILQEDAVGVVSKLLQAVRTPVEWHGQLLRVGMSAGIAMYPRDGGTFSHLLRAADAALYRSKHAGRNRITTAPPLGRPMRPETAR